MTYKVKFRAWDKSTKKYWNVENWHFEGECLDLIEQGGNIADGDTKHIWRKVSDVVVEQYTGTEDANGKPIYANDFISFDWYEHGDYGLVEWNKNEGRFEVHFGTVNANERDLEYKVEETMPWEEYYDGKPTVVGNCHENPEQWGR